MNIESQHEFAKDHRVRHVRLGEGRVVVDNGLTVVVRFDSGIEECDRVELVAVLGPVESMVAGLWGSPLEAISRLQAEAIRSVNGVWGVFARSKIDLLPHQLWVCRQVLSSNPARWLIADDVGLGKTVEAGLVLMALASRGKLGRLLILCPASLVQQWQQRMLEMFDVRVARYHVEADTDKSNFWHIHGQVIASVQTLRADHRGRHERLLEADPWDTVIVDEAHHLNADEEAGPTLSHRLVGKMVEQGRVRSMLFFTGTPHRGKNYGFFALLRLLRPDLFDPSKPPGPQLHLLSKVMIRNNKYAVTDLHGKKLFREPVVETEDYSFSPPEAAFYQMLTEFITTGKAYASGMADATQGRAVMLVLIAMQKLASSSVAAIRRAIRGRLEKIANTRSQLDRLKELQRELSAYTEAEQAADFEQLSQLEERIAECDVELRLMTDEEDRLRELLDASNKVTEETKIRRMVERVRARYPDRSVLFFTEYKATQSLLMSALIQAFGKASVTFINGDGRADDVVSEQGGEAKSVVESRDDAADRFNEGQVRFLVSTEAAGEGIDLQERCFTLVHVDLPWNPMRMQQRVGRLNRFGQTKTVEVVVMRNPETVESRIWQKLTEKIDEINAAMANVMEHPEDLAQLVLGMAPSSLYRELFAQASDVPKERLSQWFDENTARIGGRDSIEVVREMVGHCARFNFHESSSLLPRVDLPDLQAFVLNVLQLNRRRPQKDNDGLSFKTPDAWRADPTLRSAYSGIVFDRHSATRKDRSRVIGSGHPVFEHSMRQALGSGVCVAVLPRSEIIAKPLFVYRVSDRITGDATWVRGVSVGVLVDESEPGCLLLQDWQLLQRLNEVKVPAGDGSGGPAIAPGEAERLKDLAARVIASKLSELSVQFRHPDIRLVGILWPDSVVR